MLIDNPAELGADLIADAVAAYARLGEACVVVDFGTATTFTAITGDAVVLGVAIAPGMNLAASALAGGTAQLLQIRLVPPSRAIGRNTVDSIRSGVVLGYVGLVEGMITVSRPRWRSRPQGHPVPTATSRCWQPVGSRASSRH